MAIGMAIRKIEYGGIIMIKSRDIIKHLLLHIDVEPAIIDGHGIFIQHDKFVMLDEDSVSINDGGFYIDMQKKMLYDIPGFYHNNSTIFNFADGHSDRHKWTDSWLLGAPKRTGGYGVHDQSIPQPPTADINWLVDSAWE